MGKLIIAVLAIVWSIAAASEMVDVDRYTSVRVGATQEQLDPLSSIVQIKFPPNVFNTEQAINYVLDDSGYSLIDKGYWTQAMTIMANNRLPLIHRDLSDTPMAVREVLNVVAGEHFRVVHDPLRRQVKFVLKEEYRGLVDG